MKPHTAWFVQIYFNAGQYLSSIGLNEQVRKVGLRRNVSKPTYVIAFCETKTYAGEPKAK